jgi:hypothetical protein
MLLRHRLLKMREAAFVLMLNEAEGFGAGHGREDVYIGNEMPARADEVLPRAWYSTVELSLGSAVSDSAGALSCSAGIADPAGFCISRNQKIPSTAALIARSTNEIPAAR